jgi:hypothetical protein
MRRYTGSFMQNRRYSTANSFHVDLNHSQIHSSKSVIMGFRRRHPMPKAIHFIPTRTPTPLSSPLPSSRPVTSNLAKRSHLRATNKKREPSILKSVNPSQTTHPPNNLSQPTFTHRKTRLSPSKQETKPPINQIHNNGLRQLQTRLLRAKRTQTRPRRASSATKRLSTKRISTTAATATATHPRGQSEKAERRQSRFQLGSLEHTRWLAMPIIWLFPPSVQLVLLFWTFIFCLISKFIDWKI